MAAANYSGVGSEYYSINFQDTTPRLTIELKMQAQVSFLENVFEVLYYIYPLR